MKKHALLFGYAQNEDGSLVPQTCSRCDKAAELYHKGQIERIYLLAYTSKGGQPMAHEMRNFLIARGVPAEKITVERRGGNTAGELDVFAAMVPKYEDILLISSWYHMPRIRFLAQKRFTNARTSFAAAFGHVHPVGDVLMEIPKFANSFLRPFASAKVLPSPPTIS